MNLLLLDGKMVASKIKNKVKSQINENGHNTRSWNHYSWR